MPSFLYTAVNGKKERKNTKMTCEKSGRTSLGDWENLGIRFRGSYHFTILRDKFFRARKDFIFCASFFSALNSLDKILITSDRLIFKHNLSIDN